jgi:segregation and condensation protein B
MTLDQKIEGLLFFKGEPLARSVLARFFKVTEAEVEDALVILEEALSGRGIALVRKLDEVMLGTKAELGPLFEQMRKEELSKELSKASLETLTIVLYKGAATRSEIDYIRGVNSGFILRNLLVRGLVEKETDATDSRKYVYKPTFDLISYLGVTKLEDLPEYEAMRTALNESHLEETTVTPAMTAQDEVMVPEVSAKGVIIENTEADEDDVDEDEEDEEDDDEIDE